MRPLPLLALLVSAAALSGCGIKGGLDRPPPLWGGGTTADLPEETSAAESVDNARDPFATPDTPFDGDSLDEDDNEPGFGVDVAD